MTARPGRPPWWEVPPSGYLEVESRHGPTRPRALRALARHAARAGLSWDPGRPLPVQRYVQAQERARLVFHARRELPRVTAAASQVMLVDSRLAEAEELLDRAVRHRSSAPGQATGPAAAPSLGQPSEGRTLGLWSAVAMLAAVAGGEGVAASLLGRSLRLGPVALALLTLAAPVVVIAVAQLAARGLDRLGAGPDGSEDPARRRWLDVAVGGAALACGMTLALAAGHLTAGAGRTALGLALLGLATAASYAAMPERLGGAGAGRWRLVVGRLRLLLQGRRRRRQLRKALGGEAAAQATVRQLRQELAVLVPQLLAAEQAALLFWRYQAAIGDAAQHAFEQHLAAFTLRRSRGVWRAFGDWWRGTPPAQPGDGGRLTPLGAELAAEWGEQVAQVTMAAKRVLVRRGLLDITHRLRPPRLAGAPLVRRDGRPAGSTPDSVAGNGDRPPVEPAALDRDR